MLRRLQLGVLGLFLLSECVHVQGQQNSWTNPISGRWEEMHWSLGQLPGPGQAVFLSNPGWKAVGIWPSTAQGFPQTLQPATVTISAPANSFNVLLLNFSGFQTPLSVKQLRIFPNGALVALHSALNVDNIMGGAFSIGGALNQGASATVSAVGINVGDIGPGAYNLTNGSVVADISIVIGGNFPSSFNQFGGTNCTETLELQTGGEYDAFGGSLTTSNIIFRPGSSVSGSFNQYGGLVTAGTVYATMGGYFLAGGTFSSSEVQLPGVTSVFDSADLASFLQTGGTNFTGVLSIGTFPPPFFNASPSGSYTLSNGVLVASSTVLGPFGNMEQWGGIHSASSLELSGDETASFAASPASYTLRNGVVSSRALSLSLGRFVQRAGTNQVAGNLTVLSKNQDNSSFVLSAGLLMSSNTMVVCDPNSGGGFTQSGGTQIISNLLTVSRTLSPSGLVSSFDVDFLLTGGQLLAQNIRVEGGAIFHDLGGSLTSAGLLTLANGTWDDNVTSQSLGRLQLGVSQSGNSSISFPSNASTLFFSNCSSVTWSGQANLMIEHWNGSLSGGGFHQLYFGTDSSGLSAQQLAQIHFHDPDGMPGFFPAQILSTGEVVPTQILVGRHSGNGLALSWPPGMILQTSTNVSGPYEDVTASSNSRTFNFSEPKRFFRLRIVPAIPETVADY